MNDIPGECRKAEKRIAAAGLSMDDFYERAGIHRTTWMRWRDQGLEPRLATFRRAMAAVPDGKRRAA